MQYTDILQFWFDELKPKQWFVKDAALDQLITNRFSAVHAQASAAELNNWRINPHGRLAEIIVLDQFSRNIYRDTAQAFCQDALALALAQYAVAMGDVAHLNTQQQSFLLMPYMHSESLLIHEQSLKLFDRPGLENSLKFAQAHQKIIARFGRYPHRNKILARASSDEEIKFLATPGSSF